MKIKEAKIAIYSNPFNDTLSLNFRVTLSNKQEFAVTQVVESDHFDSMLDRIFDTAKKQVKRAIEDKFTDEERYEEPIQNFSPGEIVYQNPFQYNIRQTVANPYDYGSIVSVPINRSQLR